MGDCWITKLGQLLPAMKTLDRITLAIVGFQVREQHIVGKIKPIPCSTTSVGHRSSLYLGFQVWVFTSVGI